MNSIHSGRDCREEDAALEAAMLTGWLAESHLRGRRVERMQAASERQSRGQSYHSLNKRFTSRMKRTGP